MTCSVIFFISDRAKKHGISSTSITLYGLITVFLRLPPLSTLRDGVSLSKRTVLLWCIVVLVFYLFSLSICLSFSFSLSPLLPPSYLFQALSLSLSNTHTYLVSRCWEDRDVDSVAPADEDVGGRAAG